MPAENSPVPTILALIPHPDDESYSFGGTLALAARAGWACHVECASAGERGKRHDGGLLDPGSVAGARTAELAQSCRILGARPPRVWGLPDGGMREAPSQVSRIVRLFEEFNPDLVLSLGCDGAYGHPDHIALYHWVRAAREAWRGAGPPLLFAAFPAGLFIPQWQRCIGMLGEPPEPPASAIGCETFHYELPIGRAREAKLAAIAAHRTQLPGGDAEALFPPGIVASLLAAERFHDARGIGSPEVEEILHAFAT